MYMPRNWNKAEYELGVCIYSPDWRFECGCGCNISDGEHYYDVDGESVCEDCFKEEFFASIPEDFLWEGDETLPICCSCGKEVNNDDGAYYFNKPGKKLPKFSHYDEFNWLCPDCVEDMFGAYA